MKNIVSKGEIACFEQFLLLSLCFQKAVCCGGVSKRLYEGKDNRDFLFFAKICSKSSAAELSYEGKG